MTATLDDAKFLRQAFALAQDSRDRGNHPFATLIVGADGTVLATGQNAWHRDPTAHAEMNAIREAAGRHDAATLAGATLYTNAEPCAMCAGGVYWSGISRVVYALSEAGLLALTGAHPENPTLALPCREVFARGQRPIEVIGPMLEDEARVAHRGFWNKGG